MTFQRTIQILSLVLFLLLLFAAAYSLLGALPVDLFLRFDPFLVLVTALSSRFFIAAFIPALILLFLSLFLGRFFCGYICPMGTTLDAGDRLMKPKLRSSQQTGGPGRIKFGRIKYWVLVFSIGAALLGVSFVFLASPLSLITRFYGLLVHPLIALLADGALNTFRPLAEWLDVNALLFAHVKTPRYAAQIFILAFFISAFSLSRISPRFWCRYLCPSGALFALFSRRPLLRRRVSETCTDCGKCAGACPMNAIAGENPGVTRHEECLLCRTCEGICPANAVSFSFRIKDSKDRPSPFSPSRRQWITAGLTGAATAAVGLTGVNALYGKPGPGQVAPEGLIRPPGALPERAFLARCVRCGECMAACPTNTLQPLWLKAGFMGLFSPAMTPRRGFCNPECHLCASVCPTRAIRSLDKNERVWAKTGTAVISRRKCLAWEHQKSCMVCDEVCPFKAIEFRIEPGNPVPVPRVLENECAGCGSCEHYCPVQNRAAITVSPMGELRLARGSFREQGRKQGLDLSLFKPVGAYGSVPLEEQADKGPAPGFTD